MIGFSDLGMSCLQSDMLAADYRDLCKPLVHGCGEVCVLCYCYSGGVAARGTRGQMGGRAGVRGAARGGAPAGRGRGGASAAPQQYGGEGYGYVSSCDAFFYLYKCVIMISQVFMALY